MVVFGWAAAGRGGSIKVMRPLRILFATPEVEPFVKAGGLGDMVGALPKELAALGLSAAGVGPFRGF